MAHLVFPLESTSGILWDAMLNKVSSKKLSGRSNLRNRHEYYEYFESASDTSKVGYGLVSTL